MNLNSNRPTSVSRLVWDADLEAKAGYKFKGDILGRVARYCGLTMSSASGVVSSRFPTFGLDCTTPAYSGSGKYTSSFTLDVSEFINSLMSPVYGSDGSSIYYPDFSEDLVFNIPYIIDAVCWGTNLTSYYKSHDFSFTLEFYDKNGLKIDTVSISGETGVSDGFGNWYDGTIPFLCCKDLKTVRVVFTAYAALTGSYYVIPRLYFPGTPVYFSGV